MGIVTSIHKGRRFSTRGTLGVLLDDLYTYMDAWKNGKSMKKLWQHDWKDGWFGATPISGNLHIFYVLTMAHISPCFLVFPRNRTSCRSLFSGGEDLASQITGRFFKCQKARWCVSDRMCFCIFMRQNIRQNVTPEKSENLLDRMSDILTWQIRCQRGCHSFLMWDIVVITWRQSIYPLVN